MKLKIGTKVTKPSGSAILTDRKSYPGHTKASRVALWRGVTFSKSNGHQNATPTAGETFPWDRVSLPIHETTGPRHWSLSCQRIPSRGDCRTCYRKRSLRAATITENGIVVNKTPTIPKQCATVNNCADTYTYIAQGAEEFNRSCSIPCVSQYTIQQLVEEFATYWLEWWAPQNNNIAGARKLK